VNVEVGLERPTTRLKALLARKGAAILPGTPNALFARVIESVREVLGSLKHTGSLDEVRARLASFDERQRAVAKERYDALEARYRE
jgi:hypothetical protein